MMKEKILFMGTPPIARTMLERLVSEGYEIVGVLTQPDRRVGRKKQLQCSAVKEYALQQGLPIWQPVRIRDDHEELLKVEMDLIVTCAYGQFVPQALLDHPRFGAVNLPRCCPSFAAPRPSSAPSCAGTRNAACP